MSIPLEGCPSRQEFEIPSVDPDGPRILAAPGFPVFVEGPTTRGAREAVRVEADEIPSLIEVLRQAKAHADKGFRADRGAGR